MCPIKVEMISDRMVALLELGWAGLHPGRGAGGSNFFRVPEGKAVAKRAGRVRSDFIQEIWLVLGKAEMLLMFMSLLETVMDDLPHCLPAAPPQAALSLFLRLHSPMWAAG